jgi:hypothetical protein
MIHKFNLSAYHLVELLYEFLTQVVLLGRVWYRHFQLLFIWYGRRFKCLIPEMKTNTLFGPILRSMLIVSKTTVQLIWKHMVKWSGASRKFYVILFHIFIFV